MKTLIKILFLSIILCGAAQAMNAKEYEVPSVQQQLDLREATECEQKVMKYRKKLKDHPKSPYYKFMFNLWYKRCPTQ